MKMSSCILSSWPPPVVVQAALMVVVLVGLGGMVKEAEADCGATGADLLPCLAAAKANIQPSPACCQHLASYSSDAGEACLCAAANDPRLKSSGAQIQYAILIPQKCNLKYKAGYVCQGVVIPGGQ